MQDTLKESVLIGGVSFAAPFLGAWLFCAWVLGWSTPSAQIAGVALSTTSLAVVYTVLVETGLTLTPLGKLIMASTFVTDFGTALALALLFVRPTWWLVPFLGVSVLVIWAMVTLQPWFFSRYGERVIEPEIKGAVAALLVLMFFADKAQSHAVLPAFVLGLALARIFHEHPAPTRRFRVVTFALLTPFFFLKGGMNVSLALVWANLGLLVVLFAVKQVTKFFGVYPLARRYVRHDAMFTTLLMSTGLTFGTISSLYGLNAGILDRAQFSVLVSVVTVERRSGGEGSSDLREPRQRADDLRLVVDEMAHDDVGVAHRPEPSELLRDRRHVAPDQGTRLDAAIAAVDDGARCPLGLGRGLTHVDVATDSDRRRRALVSRAARAIVRDRR